MPEKILRFADLSSDEKTKYVSLINRYKDKKNWSDARRADHHDEQARNFWRAVATAGVSIVVNQGLSIFYAMRGRSGVDSELNKYLCLLKERYKAYDVDVMSFPNFPPKYAKFLKDMNILKG